MGWKPWERDGKLNDTKGYIKRLMKFHYIEKIAIGRVVLFFLFLGFLGLVVLDNSTAQTNAVQENVNEDTLEQEKTIIDAFQRTFARGSLSTKINVLLDAVEMEISDKSPLIMQALDFVMQNISVLRNDATTKELAVLAVRLAAIEEITEAAPLLWELFETSKDSTIRIATINGLGTAARNNNDIIRKINMWLSSQNNEIRSGRQVDNQIVAEAVVALGKLGDESSFPILFSASVLGYPREVSYRANNALDNIDADRGEMLLKVLSVNPAEEKNAALKMALESDDLAASAKAEISKKALSLGLDKKPADAAENKLFHTLRYDAARGLADLGWSDATPLMVDHFNRAVDEYHDGKIDTNDFINSINFLKSMETHEAAVRLAQYLDMLNSFIENGQAVDEQVALQVVQALGSLGDRVAFDHLLYTGYLDYPQSVKRAAREALNNLKTR